jgi:hypothetical protein
MGGDRQRVLEAGIGPPHRLQLPVVHAGTAGPQGDQIGDRPVGPGRCSEGLVQQPLRGVVLLAGHREQRLHPRAEEGRGVVAPGGGHQLLGAGPVLALQPAEELTDRRAQRAGPELGSLGEVRVELEGRTGRLLRRGPDRSEDLGEAGIGPDLAKRPFSDLDAGRTSLHHRGRPGEDCPGPGASGIGLEDRLGVEARATEPPPLQPELRPIETPRDAVRRHAEQ